MIDFFLSLNPAAQPLLAGCFTWGVTALGAAVVFFTRGFNQRLLDGMLGFAGGVMIAASFWSLLIPALELAEELAVITWLPAAVGFAAGWLFLMVLDRLIPHLHIGLPVEQAEGIPSSLHRSTLLVMAITLHNIPEGLAIGVAFGAVAAGIPAATIAGAIALAIGIGIQNFPEGLAISMPLRGRGCHGSGASGTASSRRLWNRWRQSSEQQWCSSCVPCCRLRSPSLPVPWSSW